MRCQAKGMRSTAGHAAELSILLPFNHKSPCLGALQGKVRTQWPALVGIAASVSLLSEVVSLGLPRSMHTNLAMLESAMCHG